MISFLVKIVSLNLIARMIPSVTATTASISYETKKILGINKNVSYDVPEYPSLPAHLGFEQWQAVAKLVDREYFGGFFVKNNLIKLVAAMVMVESGGGWNLERKVSAKDTSYGPMQVTPYTAADIYQRGFQAFPPIKEVLMTSLGGMYYGMAYIKILWTTYNLKTYQKIAQAYNGGPGIFYSKYYKTVAIWQQAYNNTINHWNKIAEFV